MRCNNYCKRMYLLLIIPALCVIWCAIYEYKRRKRTGGIYSPIGIPFIGHLFYFPRKSLLPFRFDYAKFLPWMSELLNRHDGILYLDIACIRFYVTNHPDVCQAVLRTSEHNYKSYLYRMLQPWLGRGLVVNNPPLWKSRREIIRPYFMGSLLRRHTDTIYAACKLLSVPTHTCTDIVPIITEVSLHIIARAAMGIDLQQRDMEHRKYMRAVQDISLLMMHRIFQPWKWNLSVYHLTSPTEYNQFQNTIDTLRGFTRGIIATRRSIRNNMDTNTDENTDEIDMNDLSLIDTLIDAGLDDESIEEEIETFIFEGHDTTSSHIAWTLYLLAQYPDYQQRLREELSTVDTTDIDALLKCGLFNAIMKESMRMYSPLPMIGRTLQSDVSVNIGARTITIPKDNQIMVNIHALHYNPDIYPNPEQFHPERFFTSEESVETSSEKQSVRLCGRNPFDYLPFSAGERNCVGMRFAKREAAIILASIVTRYRFVLVNIEKIKPKIKPLLIVRPNHLWLQFDAIN